MHPRDSLHFLRRLAQRHDSVLRLIALLFRLKDLRRGSYRVVPARWLDEFDATEEGLLRQGCESLSYGPKDAISGHQTVAPVKLPEIRYRRFENAIVTAHSSSVVLSRSEILVERVRSANGGSGVDYAVGHLLAHAGDRAAVRITHSKREIETGIFIAGNGAFNYFHWLMELFPKLQFLPLLPERYRSYPLLVSEDVAAMPTFSQSLERLGLLNELIYLDRERSQSVGDLIYIDTPNGTPLNLLFGPRCDAAQFLFDRESIEFIRQSLTCDEESGRGARGERRLFLARGGGRRSYNEDAVAEVLERYGFSSVRMERLSLTEQAKLVAEAEWIAGPAGAAWTNLVFANVGTRGICWMPEEYGDFSAFSNIAAIVGVDLEYLTYSAGAETTAQGADAGYTMDIDALEKALARRLSASKLSV